MRVKKSPFLLFLCIALSVSFSLPIFEKPLLPEEQSADSSKIQENFTAVTSNYDIIFRKNGVPLVVEIVEVNLFEVIYNYPLNNEKNTLSKSIIQQIAWADGTTDNFEKSIEKSAQQLVFTEKDWMRVSVASDPKELIGLEEKGEISAYYIAGNVSDGSQYLEKNALIIARKRAARLKAHKILITSQIFETGYGDMPKIQLKALAYGYPN